ncbi:Flp pilus assembly protein CpaB [Govanella unica]|uniref:Flp pilus assembly protein CpaB n=1 Tax=Govanella unica TaxID=2975056 RepID=A0A9X3Z8B5_9PROT|nr:Flp pilus assembly protein CpaB [Govania unica]MDA5194971.1 Flp pilus assembly protein CpaB [Govania unica]
MNSRSVLMIVAALVIAGAAAFLARSWLGTGQPTETAQAEKKPAVEVLVAAANLPSGRLIQKGDLTWQHWPEKNLSEHYIRKVSGSEDADLMGAVVRTGVHASEPLTQGGIVKKGERGFMSAILAPGMRAVSIRVSATTGVSGFIFPGDRVDLILTQSIDRDNGPKLRASETVLKNARVLGIDQRADDQENAPNVAKTVTIEVSPAQAEQIALLSDMGDMTLSLRSLGDPDITTTEDATLDKGSAEKGQTITWDRDVSRMPRMGGNHGASGKGPTVDVTRGNKTEQVAIGGHRS